MAKCEIPYVFTLNIGAEKAGLGKKSAIKKKKKSGMKPSAGKNLTKNSGDEDLATRKQGQYKIKILFVKKSTIVSCGV
jgi:hypothetical protein